MSLPPEALRRLVDSALAAPNYPKEQVERAWHANGMDAPIPTLSVEDRDTARATLQAIGAYRAARPSRPPRADGCEAWMRYHQAGLLILLHDLRTARFELEALSKALRSQHDSPAEMRTLHTQVLGSLQWIASALHDPAAARRFQQWHRDMLDSL